MIDVKQIHIDNDYFIEMSNNQESNICVVKLPGNIIEDLPEITTIYELEDEKISVYRNKQKFLSKFCPNYAKRVAVWAHILKLIEGRFLDGVPVVITNKNDKKIYDNINTVEPIYMVLSEPDLHTDVELESILMCAIASLAKNEGQVPAEVVEGFKVCANIFMGD